MGLSVLISAVLVTVAVFLYESKKVKVVVPIIVTLVCFIGASIYFLFNNAFIVYCREVLWPVFQVFIVLVAAEVIFYVKDLKERRKNKA